MPVSGDEPAIGPFDLCDDKKRAPVEGFLKNLFEATFIAPALPPLLVREANAGFRLLHREAPLTRSLGEVITRVKRVGWRHVPVNSDCMTMHRVATSF